MSSSPWSPENPAPVELRMKVRQALNQMDLDELPPGWEPRTAAQKLALDSEADILFFGGAAGSLKTETMLVDAIRERANPNLRGIIFRQSFPQMSDIVEKTSRLYKPLGATYNGAKYFWTFPSGATVRLAYISTDKDVWEYLGPRYSFIGFDESTLHTEYQVRNILGRLSSTDKTLKLRMRLASNPGNIGAGWHKKMFLKDACPVHAPDECVKAGALYWDASWPSDGQSLQDPDGNGFSVSFIPGRLTDHSLLDAKYVYRLRQMSGSLSSAMEQGCWCALQGAYFAIWNKARMVVPYASIEENWWDSHFLSLDYGIGKSSASAHLHVRLQSGKTRTIGEFVAPDISVHEFGTQVIERLIAPLYQGKRRRIVAVFADPANFNKLNDLRAGTGGHSVSDQLDELLAPYGLACQRAANDRIGGWQLMYRLLNSGEWAVSDTCPKLIEAIPSRMHDEKKPGDLKKIPGDPLDDAMDDVRYGLYSFIDTAPKPLEVRVQEVMRALPEDDVTSRMIRYQQLMDKEKESSQPVGMGRRSIYNRARGRR